MWIDILLVLLILVLFLYIAGWIYRRRIFRKIDQLEKWKMAIDQRPIADEISRIKGLKMAGETERHFEKWKRQWDEIVTKSLPDVEELLLDIEDYANSFRFIMCNKLLEAAQERLESIEASLDNILAEVNQLVQSEEQNRKKMTVVHEQLQELKRLLPRHTVDLGISYPVWLDYYQQAEEWYRQFQEAQQNGNYLQAQDLLGKIEEKCRRLYEAIEVCPALNKALEHDLPRKLQEAEMAIKEMRQKGYAIEATGVKERLAELYKFRQEALSHMQSGDLEAVQTWKGKVEEGLEEIYLRLEKEVENKKFVERQLNKLEESSQQLTEAFLELKKQVADFKLAYFWDQDWETKYGRLEEEYKTAQKIAEWLKQTDYKSAGVYAEVKPELDRYLEMSDKLMEGMAQLAEEIHHFRQDELEAKKVLQQLKKDLSKAKSELRKSNLPGLPDHVQSGLALAEEALQELKNALEQKPLDMHRVKHQLAQAKAQVQSIRQVAETVIDLARKAELYIQYANRFRNQDEQVRAILEDAEKAFRDWQYREALELAEEALDRADKNWRDRHLERYKPSL